VLKKDLTGSTLLEISGNRVYQELSDFSVFRQITAS